MRSLLAWSALVSITLASTPVASHAQGPDPAAAMRWREIGPTRAGRARAIAGVPSQPNVFYAGFDNGGVWRSTDYGSTWQPIFDNESTGSIGAIAVAPTNPDIIYVGTGAGIIRPDLAVGNGVYKSTDGGKTWTHLGLRNSQMIAMIDVDPKNPDRLFVAALGHPYGPNEERGIFRSTDGGRTFEKVLYKDEYTSGDDVRIDPSNPDIVYAALWQQQEAFSENGRGFGGSSGGIFKSTDGGTTWKQLTDGLPTVLQANLAVSASNSRTIYAMVAGTAAAGGAAGGRGAGGRGGFGAGSVGLYRSTDGGEHWRAMDPDRDATPPVADNRPLGRIGGGDLPTITVDPNNENVIYSCSTVFWRSDDGGVTWSAVRGAPGGDDYQKSWINPRNSNIIFVVADQGAVISANHGESWSNWYTQPTAAVYHVTADNSFPYDLCGGQQDSGSACVSSSSNDGEITFHDWHPVNIQEYGIAAPDPRHPEWVFGSQRTGVSLFNRVTGQTRNVGPDETGFNRNVRTMPILWSPVNPDVLYYASNAVWKTADRGHSWTRISPDLARQTWAVPATAGKYAASVTPAPTGTITAFSASPRSAGVLWAGTDDGNIQVTMNGGRTWSNVTPPAIQPWTRIFNIDAGHFDTLTAYAAANTLRLDDMRPHFWRTHDGGRTWTEIDNGITPDAVANSIREDPHKKGLLFGATDTQVWVSYDDGDHWESLRINMPAISVRDIEIKDDSTCLCSDLVAGTHGRGFWILDDITALRQMAEARDAATAHTAYLFKPVTAVRVRRATNDPTPWPPEVPAGENPPPGALIDYYLGTTPSQPVTLDIVDGAGRLVRSYTSADTARNPDPATDPAAYNLLCKRTPTLPDCGLPLYWPAPSMVLSATPGMHRFSWDMRFEPVGEGAGGRGGGGSGGAVPHHTYPQVNAPWAPAGVYSVRLTVDGKHYTQPITLKLDPRIKTPPLALAQLNTLTQEMYRDAQQAHLAWLDARSLAERLGSSSGAEVGAFKARVDSIAPEAAASGRGFGGRGGGFAGGRGGRGAAGPPAPPNLETAGSAALAAAMAMQAADEAPTANQIAACARARTGYDDVMRRWTALKTTGLAALNARIKAGGGTPVAWP